MTRTCSFTVLIPPSFNVPKSGVSELSVFSSCRITHLYRSSSADIPAYSTPEGVDEFVGDGSVTKSGATITYGPYHNVGPSTNTEFLSKYQQPVSVHYNYDYPVLEVTKLQRSAEVSHWGSNLNIEDKIDLHNAGPL